MDLEAFMAEWKPDIEHAIERMCARWNVMGADVEDLAGALRLHVLRNDGRVLRRFQGHSAKGTYLFRVFHGVACDWIESGWVRRRHEVQAGDTYYAYAAALAGGPSPETEAERHERRRIVLAALPQLGPLDRTIMSQRLDDISPEEIAAQHGLSVKTVRNRTSHAIGCLREIIGRGGAGKLRLATRRLDAGAGIPKAHGDHRRCCWNDYDPRHGDERGARVHDSAGSACAARSAQRHSPRGLRRDDDRGSTDHQGEDRRASGAAGGVLDRTGPRRRDLDEDGRGEYGHGQGIAEHLH